MLCRTGFLVVLFLGEGSISALADPTTAQLEEAKSTYNAIVNSESDKLLSILKQQRDRLIGNKSLKVDLAIKLQEGLDKDIADFQADPKNLPRSIAVQPAVADYLKAINTAAEKCGAAFEAAAKAKIGNSSSALEVAKAILKEREKFFREPIGRSAYRGVWDSALLMNFDHDYVRDGMRGEINKQLQKDVGSMVLAREAFGRRNVICSHPIAKNVPARINFSAVTGCQRGTLTIWAFSSLKDPRKPGGRVIVLVDGKVFAQADVHPKQKWMSIHIPFAGQQVVVEHHALGWNNEGMYFDYEIK